jgi:hypothetical protein
VAVSMEHKFEQQNMNRNYEEAEEYGVRDVSVGNCNMEIRHIEKRYSSTTRNTRPKERRKEGKRKIFENEKAYVLVNIIKTEKRTNNWFSSTKVIHRFFTRCLMKENQVGHSAKENFME